MALGRGLDAPRAPVTDDLRLLSGLRRRLMLMLIVPLLLLAAFSAWLEYRSAGNVAHLQDKQLQALLPLLADSVIAGTEDASATVLLLAPGVEQFVETRPTTAAYAITDPDGSVLHGHAWLAGLPLTSTEPEFHSEEYGGTTWRIARQRQSTLVGDVVVSVADGSDPRQQWATTILLKVMLPHLVLVAAAAFAVRWAVDRALRPLLALTEVVERRSPQDLSAIDPQGSPQEVRPLVAALNRLFSLVEAQAESQRRFVADAAHQLRTPLAGLQAQVEAWAQAARRIAAPGGKGSMLLSIEQIEKLRGATRRTSQLAHQLLALSRADSRLMEAQPREAVDLNSLCEAMLEQHLDAATHKRIDLGLEAQPATITGHAWLLRELLNNLVDNAVRYTPEGGTITIRCGRRAGERAFLEVEDDGPGVPEADRPRVLQRFYRVPGTQGEGTGLGLAIADEIARIHDTPLELSAGAHGRGLRVGITFPR